uniref:Mannosidase 2, alpha B1 n=1 Tax=Mus musculus TaxID=10090 RepID=A0A1B0GRA4_MOUSE
MGTGPLTSGVRAGGGNTGWLWMSSCNLDMSPNEARHAQCAPAASYTR